MAVSAALVFAGQMINYTIPGTGSSGHMCGGLLALGANVWNMAFYGCFVGYYLIWRPIMRGGKSHTKAAVLTFVYEARPELIKDAQTQGESGDKMSMKKLIASHDLEMIRETCSRVLLLGNGRVVADGATDEILGNAALLEQYRLEVPISLK